jgi:phosphoribosyl-ATP pyrophosphohydrolase/phosphoribosyl-AMP cyclohydrolase
MSDRNAPLTLADIGGIAWEKMDGLIPAIVQDRSTLQVLMVAYMNREALEETLRTGKGVFFSRSRQSLWRKGETSGAWLENAEVFSDCDQDCLLVLADPAGPVCHRGTVSCFDQESAPGIGSLMALERVIDDRLNDGDAKSYTKKLADSGLKRVAQKLGEEGVETALAAAAGNEDETLEEAADLIFHLLVLLRMRGLSLADVAERLRARRK